MQFKHMNKMGVAGVLLKQFKYDVIWILLFSLVVNLLVFTPTLYMMQIYTRIFISHSLMSLLIISIALVFFLLIMTYADVIRSKVLITLGNKVEVSLSKQLFSASLQRFLHDKSTDPSEYLRALVEFKQFVAGLALVHVVDILWSPLYVAVAFMLHPVLGWVSVVAIVIQCCLIVLNHFLNAKTTAQQHQLLGEQQHLMHANFRNLLPMFAMGFIQPFKHLWLSLQWRMQVQGRQVQTKLRIMQSIIRYYRYVIQTIGLGMGSYLAIKGHMSVGSMIAANLIISRSLSPFDQLTQMWPQWIAFLKSNQTLTTLFEPQPGDGISHLTRVSAPANSLVLRQWEAGYIPGQPVVHTVDFDIHSGEIVAVMGASGSGKTTFVKSLLSLVNQSRGEIEIDQQPVASIHASGLAAITGYLPQDFQLFEGTIAENITRFGPLNSEAITAAAMVSGIHEWVLRLPRGYDTMIGPNGQALSGGQKQQLGLARAVYGDASLIVLDEPNSSLDDQGERSLNQLLLSLKARQKMVIVVSHREQVLSVVDKILWLENGQVKAFGDRNAVYAALKK